MSNKENLIAYLIRNGKDLSWHELAKAFGYDRADSARNAWLRYRQDNPGTPTYLTKPAQPVNNIVGSMIPGVAERLRSREQYMMDLEDKITKFEEDLTKGTAQVEALVGQEIKTLEELVEKCKIDLTKWQITKWVQNFWNNKYQVKAFLAPKEEKNKFQENFMKYLETWDKSAPITLTSSGMCNTPVECWVEGVASDVEALKPNGCLIINKQDLHFDKYDIKGNNDIRARFAQYKGAVERIVKKANLSYHIAKLVYVIGSDEFNSEWTGMTTKGTPQKNMVDYHQGFDSICRHEVEIITELAKACPSLEVIYMPGNHDEYVGWHLITWLQAYFKGHKILFDARTDYRKYGAFGNSLMMFNHGDIIKPEKLAAIFPQEAKESWSNSNYQYIFTGDKHHEKTLDMDGIMFYQLTQGSNATSKWDSKQGYLARGFLTAFVISENWGMADIYKEKL